MLLIASSRSQLRAPFFAATSGLCADRRVAARRFLSFLLLQLNSAGIPLAFRSCPTCLPTEFAHVHLAKSNLRVYL